uniref:Antigenic thaumatin-like protein n=1 Tax=Bionectria ochroleuca TaxID=29856 RepID=A0A8H7KCF0_BIOOC
MVNFKYTAAVAALASGASASLKIHNYCDVEVSVVSSHNGGCDSGPDGVCVTAGGTPWTIKKGGISTFDWIANGDGTSLKISKKGVEGVLQFEYAMATGEYGGLYWDLSDLDGKGNGLVGTPFFNDNVKVSPTGKGVGTGTCVQLRCTAGQTCVDSYQHPDDPNTKNCPVDTGDMWLDLCQPVHIFTTRDEEAAAPLPAERAEEAVPENHQRAHARHLLTHNHGVHHS